jgi:two-component system nitrogen regulation response regulator GlnG
MGIDTGFSGTPLKVLVVDDDHDLCDMLKIVLSRSGFEVLTAHDGNAALRNVSLRTPDVVLLDVKMPAMDGMQVLRRLRDSHPMLPVVMMTAFAGVTQAVDAIKAGALDYLPKPFDNRHVVSVLNQAVEQFGRTLVTHGGADAADAEDKGATALLRYLSTRMGGSAAVRALASEMATVAATDFSVVIQGETGTGKELVARTLHDFSTRAAGPFIALDCGAIPDTLLESELFGHEKGAFTSADSRSIGKVEAAQGGTLFLDEIGNMSLQAQASMLRVLQERVVYRVGAQQGIAVDVRVLVATNEDLQRAVAEGRFREDLWYRLNEYQLLVPPLRERGDDILHLAERFRRQAETDLLRPVPEFSTAAQAQLQAYEWPGNVRELRAVVRRAALLAEERIEAEHVSLPVRDGASADALPADEGSLPVGERSMRDIVFENTQQLERAILVKALGLARGNKAEAARLLQVDYKTVHNKIKRFGLQV